MSIITSSDGAPAAAPLTFFSCLCLLSPRGGLGDEAHLGDAGALAREDDLADGS
jgi:hypothetical protein